MHSLHHVWQFSNDIKGTDHANQDDPIVVSIIVENFMVSKVLID